MGDKITICLQFAVKKKEEEVAEGKKEVAVKKLLSLAVSPNHRCTILGQHYPS